MQPLPGSCKSPGLTPLKLEWNCSGDCGAVAQWSDDQQLKQEALDLILGGYPGFFHLQLAYGNANGMEDLWCSSTVWRLSTDMNGVKGLWQCFI